MEWGPGEGLEIYHHVFLIASVPERAEDSMVKIRLVLGFLQCPIKKVLAFSSQLCPLPHSICYPAFNLLLLFCGCFLLPLLLILERTMSLRNKSLYYSCSGVSGRNTIRCLYVKSIFIPRSPG